MRLLLGGFAVAGILACAACIVLATIVGATLNYRARVTEQAAVEATADVPSPDLSGPVVPPAITETTGIELTPPAVESPGTPAPKSNSSLPVAGPTEPASVEETTPTLAPTAPLESPNLITPSEITTTLLAAQVSEIPGPNQALELTPTSQLTLSAVIFIENAGQLPPDVRFQVRGATGGGVWLASDAIWLTLLESGSPEDIEGAGVMTGTLGSTVRQGVRLKFSFVGANPNPDIVPFDRLDTHASYFLGTDPAAWHTDVPVWGGVRYREIYPGVDLEVSGEGGHYVQKLVVQAGADLNAVRLRIDGAQDVKLEPLAAGGEEQDPPGSDLERGGMVNSAGTPPGLYYLRLTTAIGELSLPLLSLDVPAGSAAPAVDPPSVLDVENGKVVDSPFFARSAPRTSTNTTQVLPATSGPQDKSIHLLYSAFLGRGGTDKSNAIAVDAAGSAYVAGDSYLSTLLAEPGAFAVDSGGDSEVLAVKIDATGSKLVYVTFLGGKGGETGYGIAVDQAGNAFVAGETNSVDLPVTAGAFDTKYHTGTDGFVLKLGALGNHLEYATFLGGEGDDIVRAIAVDRAGSAYVTGAAQSIDFPSTVGAQDIHYEGERDAFVAKFDNAGTGLAYSTFFGGSSVDRGAAIAVDEAGNAYVCGSTLSSDLGIGDTSTSAYHGDGDAFVVEVNRSGREFDYVTLLGGSGADYCTSIAVDKEGNVYVAGATRSPDLTTTPWSFDPVFHGGLDAFVAKLNPTSGAMAYAAFLGGESDDQANAIAVDGLGNAYVTGFAGPSSLPQTTGAFDTNHNGQQDVFVVRINELGTALEYATYVGGSGADRGAAIAVDLLGSVYVAGTSDSPDLAVTLDDWKPSREGYVPAANSGIADAFAFKLSAGTPFLDLPVSYRTFGLAALGNVGDRGLGRVNSWFDHSYPNHSENGNLTRWDGTTFSFRSGSTSRIGESWYDGHGGTDFGWDVWNEQIFAAAPGTVIDTISTCEVGQTSCGNYFGNRVWIDHGNGYASVYAHLKTVFVSKGTVINDPASQPLGIMGNTGRSLGTHLHFGLYYDWNGDGQWTRDETVDPFGWATSQRDPSGAPNRYLWKQPLFDRQLVGAVSVTQTQTQDAVLVTPSGLVTATIPENALDSPVAVELWDVPPTGDPAAQWHSTGLAFWLRPGVQEASTQLLAPVSIRMAYRAKDMVHLDPNRLTIYQWNESGGTWSPLPTDVDTNQRQVSAQTTAFGRFDLHAPLLCPSDSIEPDDDHGAALPVATNGITVSRVFDIKNDVDWFRVEAEADKIYIVRTGHLAPGVSTVLKIYDPDSQAPLASSIAGDGGAYVQWRPLFDGAYLIQVSPASDSTYGCTASYELSIHEILPPNRVAIAGPAEGKLASSYTYTATVGPGAVSQPVIYVWQIDQQPPVTHTAGVSDTLAVTWRSDGPHSIEVSASNVAGTATATRSLAVFEQPKAGFSATPLTGPAPLKVIFANESSGEYTSILWDFGDNSTSRSKGPTHTYEVAGTYTVTLTIDGPGGTDVQTRTSYVTVRPEVIFNGTKYQIFLPNIVHERP